MSGFAIVRGRRGLAVFLPLLLLGASACGGPAGEGPGERAEAVPATAPAAAAPLRVAVSVPPQAWLVERLGGERVTTTVLLPPGGDPHAFEPSPRQAAALEGADLYFAVGHPAFPFERRLLERFGGAAGDAAPRVVRMPAAPAGGADDPHPWLAPAAMAAAAGELAAALERLDPEDAAGYRRRLAAVREEIAAADRELGHRLAGARGGSFVVHHPSWGALAAAYGLEQIAIEAEGKEPGPRRLVALVERARAAGARAVLVDAPPAPRSARAVAAELGVPVVPVDPLARDWPATLAAAGEALGAPAAGSAPRIAAGEGASDG